MMILNDEYTDEYLNEMSLRKSQSRFSLGKPPRTAETPKIVRLSRTKYRDANYMP